MNLNEKGSTWIPSAAYNAITVKGPSVVMYVSTQIRVKYLRSKGDTELKGDSKDSTKFWGRIRSLFKRYSTYYSNRNPPCQQQADIVPAEDRYVLCELSAQVTKIQTCHLWLQEELLFFLISDQLMLHLSQTQLPTPTATTICRLFREELCPFWPHLEGINLAEFRSTSLLALAGRNLRRESAFWIYSLSFILAKTKAFYKHLQNISLEIRPSLLVKSQFQHKNLCSDNIKHIT